VLVGTVFMAEESRVFASLDVSREVVDVAGVFRDEMVLFDSDLIDGGFGFDVTCLIGKNPAGKVVEHGVFFQKVLLVWIVDIGEEDESVPGIVE